MPKKDADNKDLAGWIYRQRFLHRQGRLTAGRIRRLEDLGLSWNPRAETPA